MTRILKTFSLLFVPIYYLIITLRNIFFDYGILKSEKVRSKVISIGNLVVGGSGKTPFVIYIVKLLKNLGWKPSVLSRGYGRKSKGYVLVSKDGTNDNIDVDKCGDEIYQTVLECKVPAAVSERRIEGATRLLNETDTNVIVLDDAFQHRYIKRDIDLVLIDKTFFNNTSIFNQSLLPSGLMREPFNSLKRADAIILNNKFHDEDKNLEAEEILKKFNKPIFKAYYKAISFVDMTRKTKYSLEEFNGQDSLVVSGIANPTSFLTILQKTGVSTKNHLIFKDHKNYTEKDVQLIRKTFYSTNAHSLVTTEKDAVKLLKFAREFDDIDIFYLKITLCLENEEEFIEYLKSKLNNTVTN
ncbi:MAG: tetraacyldisaccharide 4'-kinase [Ignavibacterium sp.]|nr:tetraacyldisaccharide 4'-kinase [Ignavibacterium sp.]MCX7612045.1 tetraacyldisaccharide 4'-kinase [Ignavibacterium sp.]MDW8374808.1 tetraacyldisaccharide 4'-kinase [Ignavibacteriales bacterium]